MADQASDAPLLNGMTSSNRTLELAVDLPHSPGLRLNLHLTILATSVMLFLTSTSTEGASGAAALGSFVYAMPDRYNPRTPLSTALYTNASSLDFTNRIAKLLARKLERPCYVGSSVNLSAAAGGGSVDEEMDAFRCVVEIVTAQALG